MSPLFFFLSFFLCDSGSANLFRKNEKKKIIPTRKAKETKHTLPARAHCIFELPKKTLTIFLSFLLHEKH